MVRHTGEDFIDVEGIAVASVLAFQAAGINGSELDAPQSNCFSTDRDTSFSEQLFNITMTEIVSQEQLICQYRPSWSRGVMPEKRWLKVQSIYHLVEDRKHQVSNKLSGGCDRCS